MTEPDPAPREPKHLLRTATDRVTTRDVIRRTVTHHSIEINWRFAAALALVVFLPPIPQALAGELGEAALTLILGLLGAVIGYAAVTKRRDTDTA